MVTLRFAGWPVLITGGATGIGLACAQRLAAEGARVLLVGRRSEALAAARQSLAGDGHETLVADAADETVLAPGVKAFAATVGPLRAAILGAGENLLRPLAISKAEHFERQFRSNVTTGAVAARVFVKHADKQDGATLLFVSSVAGLRGAAGASAYSAAKGAVLALSRSLAVELAPQGIRVNALVPGVVRTAMSEKFLGTLTPEQIEAVRRAHLLGFGEPADVAAAACFLVSSEAHWITGTELVVDGGLSCQ
ncbi:MAG: SDR family oxidoreductase [Opitutales bacterium]|jgi:NAD(P)-dependent dehydrogenase (short-subunit alcohol dehydrogenase family)